ncbi:ImmA/IrrE family metallo-endopeptidase [Bacillus haynesii]|uniref:ImmA/IrrE family metallo-endopeptidase n=1 Tax=Bacillus haynesii TaxID=1925021 RepID=UPI002281D674|nr:ImmA/IrrE family metallo-endopeptidase [Bacillus haynesii]MCY8540076.1 ImmA/IrrE family metallo-endopeptidase [Bacillus haynesii]
MYYLSELEEEVQNIYKKINILEPFQVDMEVIADRLDIQIRYMPNKCGIFKFGLSKVIILDSLKNKQQHWEDFCHELGHIMKHAGTQFKTPLLLKEMQENQANSFMYHFSVPTFMLNKIQLPPLKRDAIQLLTDLFNVTHTFAEKRLDIYLRKLLSLRTQSSFMKQKSAASLAQLQNI